MDLTKVTTEESAATYLATNGIFIGLFKEIRELSKKKPDAVMSAGKVKIINRVLTDLKDILEVEPEGKFLDLLDDKELPQTSDAVLVMVQYETVLHVFKSKYYQSYGGSYDRKYAWVTPEFIKEYEGDENFDEYDDDD
ncbi:MAG: hypothetical protein OQK98_07240 [Gammaproteobacteria bacterium]|nr:hypothetical protein [Gammaproteobacteria bacterium]